MWVSEEFAESVSGGGVASDCRRSDSNEFGFIKGLCCSESENVGGV